MATFTATGEMFVNTTNAGNQYGSYRAGNIAALDDGGYVVVWTSQSSPTSAVINMQRYNSHGEKVGIETKVNTFAGFDILPTVAVLNNGTYVVTWTSQNGQDGDGNGIYMQRFAANGTLLGVETRVNATTAANQDASLVTALSDGGFIVVWDSQQDGSEYGVYAQRYDAGGVTVGPEFRVNTTTTNFQDNGSTLVLSDGSLVIMWESVAQDFGTGYGVYMQRYSSTGVAQGGETLVNTTTANHQFTPKGTVLANGDFIIAWASNLQDGSSYGIYTQRYNSAGVAQGGEVRVNTTTANAQGFPVMAALHDGGYVVVWISHGQDGSNPASFGIYMQQYDSTGTKVGLETRVSQTAAGDQTNPAVTVLDNDAIVITWQSQGNIWERIFFSDEVVNDIAGAHAITGSGEHAQTINGLDGNDTLSGGTGFSPDTLNGGEGDDLIKVSGGDSGVGGNGNDTFQLVLLNGQNIFLDGGAGYDILDATASAFASGWIFTNTQQIEEFRATAFGDYLDASSETNTAMVMKGGLGNDTFKGGSLADTLQGADGNDSLNGGTGNDTVQGGSGNDVVDGGIGADNLAGGAGDDSYYVDNAGDAVAELSGEGNDTVFTGITYTLAAEVENLIMTGTGNLTGTGNGLANSLTGNNGHNVLDGGTGVDTMAGGLGNDFYVVENVGDVTTENAAAGTDTVLSSVNWTLADNIENLILSGPSNTSGVGNALNNVLTGSTSRHSLTGLGGDDTYMVDRADDAVIEATGGGTDAVWSSVSYVLAGNQYIENLLLTGTGNNNGTGNGLANSLTGNSGTNLLDGLAGADTLAGALGNDTYIVDNIGDVVTEAISAGTDIVQSSVRFTLGDNIERLLLTGTANINGTGNGLVNIITGNDGNNILDGGLGGDSLTGGLGDDTFIIDDIADTVREVSGQGTDTVKASISFALGAQYIEALLLTGASDINGTGNSLANSLTGNTGNNLLDGGAGADTLTGGLGNDTFVIDNVGDVVTESNGQGTDTVQSSIAFVLTNAMSIETLTLMGASHINATGNAIANALNGNSGNNTLNGGSGADTMAGGAGSDIYVVENIGDVVIEALNSGTDSVQSAVSFVLSANVENLTLAGSGNINATGNGLANTIYGNAGNNMLDGGGGIDRLYGRAGNDTYVIDTIGTGASEVLSGVDAGGHDVVQASVSFNLGLYIEDLTLTGTGVINGVGNDLANTIIGNGSNNILKGRLGNDTLTGGLGADQFVFEATAGQDRVTDFSAAQNDAINVHALANGVVGGGGITLSQVGGDTLIDLGGGNTVTVVGVLVADVQSHMVW